MEVLESHTGFRDYHVQKEELPAVVYEIHRVTDNVGAMTRNLVQITQDAPELFVLCRQTLDKLEAELQKVQAAEKEVVAEESEEE